MTTSDITPDGTPLHFAGRDLVYARLQQAILDPPHRHALVFTGADGIGKTALLRHFNTVFTDALLGVYLPLTAESLADEALFLWRIISGINAVLATRNFSLSRIPELQETDADDLRAWLRDVYLPQVCAVIRPARRVVLLIDDAEHLVHAPDGLLAYLHDLLDQFSQLALVLTLATEHEVLLPQLAPLVETERNERLGRLHADDCADLLRHYAPGASDALVEELTRATGGHPRLLTRYGQALAQVWASHSESEALALVRPEVYAASSDEFVALWQALPQEERLILTAIASLIYDDPRHAVSTQRIEAWLLETDFPMDRVAINAALRGLDYRDIVSQTQDGVMLVTGLMQQWLLENARLEDASASAPSSGLPLRAIALVILVVLAIIAVLLALPSPVILPPQAVATATLSP